MTCQHIETVETKRQDLLCDIISQLNQDVSFLYRGGRGIYIVARKKIRDMLETPGFKMDLASAWIDDADRFNLAALRVEIESAPVPFECPESNNAEAVKAGFLAYGRVKPALGRESG